VDSFAVSGAPRLTRHIQYGIARASLVYGLCGAAVPSGVTTAATAPTNAKTKALLEKAKQAFAPAEPPRKLRYQFDDIPGITRRRAGKSFTYHHGGGKRIADDAVLERIRFLAIPPAWEAVWISPFADGHLQATGRDFKGRKQYRYHRLWCARQDQKKYARLLKFGRMLPRVRRAVWHRLQDSRPTLDKVVAAVIALLDQTGMRVGNEEYRKTNKSHGLTTLRDSHVRFRKGKIEIACRGKSGVAIRVECRGPRLARVVRQCRDIDGAGLFQYLDERGRRRPVSALHVNAAIAELAGPGFTAKDFRTWHGTVRAAGLLRRCLPAQSKSGRERNVRQVVKEVAAALCNLPATCRKHYIHPAIVEDYIDGGMEHVNQKMTSRTSNLHPNEALVMHALSPRMKSSGRK